MLHRLNLSVRVLNLAIGGYALIAAGVMIGPISLVLFALAGIAHLARKRRDRLTTLGSARWAVANDLKSAGMLGAKSGLILGRIPSVRNARRPCRAEELVRLPDVVHTAVFAPTGVGKGVSLVIPNLLTNPESLVVLDFKAELAATTARHRAKAFGHRIVLVDPYMAFTQQPDTYNPLDSVDRNHPQAIDDCNDMANALVSRTGKETDPHWNDSAEAVIAAVAATTIAYTEPGHRPLSTLRDIIGQPNLLDLSIKLMMESTHWNGALRPMGGQILHFAEKERASVLSSAMRHLRFLGTPLIAASTRVSSFDPADLRRGKMTVYLILPPERAHAQAGLLRMWVGSMLRACVRGGSRS